MINTPKFWVEWKYPQMSQTLFLPLGDTAETL